ncbi:hypothetical protein IV38_GL000156 [Lactobacillus selangorensis]|uniref:Uncharacterized protein n=1 Tax=Lactobacillus selangorensis TaxID=81857 RepID=A0A0R2G7H8_9LACO|nr:hypothetical protein IV38_GL000156 [Lactobacillus selangorensis]KRN34197.1 hypothetical protein IV40_GL000513 [Lactobacillus selangorensis]
MVLQQKTINHSKIYIPHCLNKKALQQVDSRLHIFIYIPHCLNKKVKPINTTYDQYVIYIPHCLNKKGLSY